MIKLVVEWVVPDESESDRDSIKSTGLDDEISHLSGEVETDKKDAASKSSILSGKRSRSASRQRTTVSFVDNDFFGIQQQASATKDEGMSTSIPESRPRIDARSEFTYYFIYRLITRFFCGRLSVD